MDNTISLQDYKTPIKYDGNVQISTGKSRFEKKWKNRTMLWSALVAKLQKPVITPETYAEYKKMTKADQDNIKDVGGYVGGSLTGGKRGTGTVAWRQILTLDLDFAPLDYFDDLELISGYAACTYTTHKHSASTPRYRLLIPLDRVVTPEEYEAIARKIAEDIGMDYFDDTTYQPSRLMYWPSVSSDGEYVCRYIDAPFLKADEVLGRYPDWKDTSYWPESSRASGIKRKLAEKQGDPTEKKGIIGAFCRTYTVPEAIAKFLPEIYVQCAAEDRYTYTGGSTAAGLVIYEAGLFAYSNHGTDPASGKLCNAFDLVRIHLFGDRDEDAPGGTDSTKLPSYKAMIEFAMEDRDTKACLSMEKISQAKDEFENMETLESLQYDQNGNIINTLKNIVLLMKQDENLKGIYKNEMSGFIELDSPAPWADRTGPWRDVDDVQMRAYMESYGKFTKLNVVDAVAKLADDRKRHPVRNYLNNLPEWDGKKRVDTLLVDYLGAEDSEYVHQVTRKTLCGAVYRVMNPGCKHDTVMVLNGPTGIGKSTLIGKLAGEWFNDSLSLMDTKDKSAAEKLQGYWILEIPDLSGMRKTDVETLKGFISRQDDVFRASYGHHVESHKRQCIFIGTTNAEEEGYLRDLTGNRRFWDVRVYGNTLLKPWTLDRDTVDQIWAEVKEYVRAGESVVLTGTAIPAAEEKQKAALESDPREGMVREYLETLLPEKWYKWNLPRRRGFIQGTDFEDEEGTVQRTEVCYAEIWYECFGREQGAMTPKDSYAIASIMSKISGWEKAGKAKRIPGYGQQRVYVKK